MTIPELPATNESEITVFEFMAWTNSFLRERPLMVDHNTPSEILIMLLAELHEFFEAWLLLKAAADSKDVDEYKRLDIEMKAEIGDLGHFFNDFIVVTRQDITHAVTLNGKRDSDVTVRQLRKYSEEKYIYSSSLETGNDNDEQLLELMAFLELAIIDALEDVGNYMRLALIMTLLFEITDQLGGMDLVLMTGMKRVRNEIKYPKEIFQDGIYEEARDRSKREWKEAGGDQVFFKEFQANYAV